jgi:hypothetical protein
MAMARVDQRAVVLALADSFQLTVTATSLVGTSVAGEPVLHFASGDSTRLIARANGMLVPLGITGAPVPVIVAADYQGVTAFDTTYVQVTISRQDIVGLSLQLAPGDSARRGAGAMVTPATQFLLAGGGTTTGLFVRLEPRSRQVKVYAQLMAVAAHTRGPAWIYASGTVYGTPVADSVQYEFTAPVLVSGYLYNDGGTPTWLGQERLLLAPYGRVDFVNYFATPVSVDCGTSSPPVSINPYFTGSCTYPTPGTYTWTANTTPAIHGSVTVQ